MRDRRGPLARICQTPAPAPRRGWRCALLALALSGGLAGPAAATTDDPAVAAICDAAAQRASQESGVPLAVLRAIALTETGRTKNGAFRPWPWTVNMEGKGAWFPTLAEARAYVDRHHARGARSFDVGCFQINFRWHGEAFASIDEMFDPLANARYAARFLGELHAEFGDWSRAAGAYHSRTPTFASRYRARFDRIRARLGDDVRLAADGPERPGPDGPDLAAARLPPALDSAAPDRPNLFPLLRVSEGARGIGSLVPLGAEPATGFRLIGGPERG